MSYAQNLNQRLVALGLAHIADRFTIEEMPVHTPGVEPRIALSMTEPRTTRRGFAHNVPVSSINFETAADMTAMLEDETRLATFIDLGMQATRADNRADLPEWVAERSQAAATRTVMARANRLASEAMTREPSNDNTRAAMVGFCGVQPDNDNLPF